MIPPLAKLRRMHPDTVVGVPAGELAALASLLDIYRSYAVDRSSLTAPVPVPAVGSAAPVENGVRV